MAVCVRRAISAVREREREREGPESECVASAYEVTGARTAALRAGLAYEKMIRVLVSNVMEMILCARRLRP